jgi:hypothetical protein
MEKWTPFSQRPPRPSDGPFHASDFDAFGHGIGWRGVTPPEKALEQLELMPMLKAELERLCQTFPPEHLSALGSALRLLVKGLVKRGW